MSDRSVIGMGYAINELWPHQGDIKCLNKYSDSKHRWSVFQ